MRTKHNIDGSMTSQRFLYLPFSGNIVSSDSAEIFPSVALVSFLKVQLLKVDFDRKTLYILNICLLLNSRENRDANSAIISFMSPKIYLIYTQTTKQSRISAVKYVCSKHSAVILLVKEYHI